MVTLWRRDGSGTVQSDPEVIQSDPERSKTDPNLLDAVYDLIKENHAISRAEPSATGSGREGVTGAGDDA